MSDHVGVELSERAPVPTPTCVDTPGVAQEKAVVPEGEQEPVAACLPKREERDALVTGTLADGKEAAPTGAETTASEEDSVPVAAEDTPLSVAENTAISADADVGTMDPEDAEDLPTAGAEEPVAQEEPSSVPPGNEQRAAVEGDGSAPEPTPAPEATPQPAPVPEKEPPAAKPTWHLPTIDKKQLAQWAGPVTALLIAVICVVILFCLVIGPIQMALTQGALTKQPEWLIRFFFSIVIGVFLIGCASLGGIYMVALLRSVRGMEGEHKEYQLYVKKGYNLRAGYGFCLFVDMLLHVVELVAVGVSAYLVLIVKSGQNNGIAALLITSLVSSTIRNALNLKFSRMAYARAFRVLEFATDDFRVSPQGPEDIAALHRANERAQGMIQDLNE